MDPIQITFQPKDLMVKGISVKGNPIVSHKDKTFLMSRRNFNSIMAKFSFTELKGFLFNVEGYDIPMFGTVKF